MFINHNEKGTNRERSTCAVKSKNVACLGIVGVQVLLTLDQERWVIQLAVNVRNVLTLSVVMACLGLSSTCALF